MFQPIADDEPDEPPPPPKRGRGRPRKNPQSQEATPDNDDHSVPFEHSPGRRLFTRPGASTTGSTLTPSEAKEAREVLHDMIEYLCEIADDGIEAFTAGHEPVTIWSDMTDDEIYILVDLWLARAQKRPRAAQRVRGYVRMYESWVQPLVIVGPRAVQTGAVIKKRGLRARD